MFNIRKNKTFSLQNKKRKFPNSNVYWKWMNCILGDSQIMSDLAPLFLQYKLLSHNLRCFSIWIKFCDYSNPISEKWINSVNEMCQNNYIFVNQSDTIRKSPCVFRVLYKKANIHVNFANELRVAIPCMCIIYICLYYTPGHYNSSNSHCKLKRIDWCKLFFGNKSVKVLNIQTTIFIL
jgi:hypothetical protein